MGKSNFENLQHATNDRRVWVYGLSIVAVPLLVMIFILIGQVQAKHEGVTRAQELERMSEIARVSARAITELQRERGLSFALSAGGGAGLKSKLDQQRGETDRVLSDIRGTFSEWETEVAGGRRLAQLGGSEQGRVSTSMAEAQSILEKLVRTRRQLDAGQINDAELSAYFTEVIWVLIRAADQEATMASPLEGQRLGRMMALLLEATEYAGQERALGAYGFNLGKFDSEASFEMVSLRSAQQILLDRFRRIAPAQYREALEVVLASQAAVDLDVLRGRALSNVAGNQAFTSVWFDAATTVMAAYATLYEQVRSDQLMLSNAQRRELEQESKGMMGAIAVSVLLSLLIALWQSRQLLRPFLVFASGLRQLDDGRTKPTELIGRGRKSDA